MERVNSKEPDRDEQQDFRKICIMNMQKNETNEYVRDICQMYGEVVDFQRPKDNLAFATYKLEW